MTRTFDSVSDRTEPASEIDLRALGAALKRRRRAIVLATLLVFVLIAIFVNVVRPRYTAQTQILLENQETFFTRPDRVNLQPDQVPQVDPEAVASQVQLINSRDIARRAIKELGLEGDSEFDPLARGMGPLKRVLVLLGLAHDPTRESRDSRIVTAFLDKLVVYSPTKTRVISIEFTSRDPDLAARAANTVAQLYLTEQSAAKRVTAKAAADALASQIADLRNKLAKADDEREQYRLQSGLLAGSNNMTISGQQLADINTDLSKARAAQADSQAKASMIRELVRAGKAADVPEVINNDIVRRVSDQRVTAEAQLALESRTLLPGHPRIKALTAQVAEYDRALKNAAKQAATTLENEARIAGTRVANLETVLAQQKTLAGAANVDEVHLRALERATQSYKDQLESSTAKYQEALARQSSSATPADARVIQRATEPQEPSFPKKLPFIVFGTVATFVFAVGFVVAGELLSGRAAIEDAPLVVAEGPAPVPVEVAAVPGVAAATAPEPVAKVDAGPAPAPAPKTRRPKIEPKVESNRESKVEPRPLPGSAEDTDLVFAPVARKRFGKRPSVAALKTVVAGGILASLVARLKAFGRSATASRSNARPEADRVADRADGIGWETGTFGGRGMAESGAETTADADARSHAGSLSERIVAAHVPGRGLHIIGTSLGTESGATATLIGLSRVLAEKGRSIIVDLNRTPSQLASLAQADGDGRATIMGMNGLSELLASEASFAEVIHRDHASRLHFIPTGRQEADFRDFDLILDALSETYDFIVLLTPAYPQSEIAKIMAPYADFVVLTAANEPDDKMLAVLEAEMMEAGAREVLVANTDRRPPRQEVA